MVMAKAAVVESYATSPLYIGRPASVVIMKRKTPSELRGEQLQRKRLAKLAGGQLQSSAAVDRSTNGLQNQEQPKVPKYINSRVSEVFPVKKSSERCRVLYGKENLKDVSTIRDKSDGIDHASAACSILLNNGHSFACSSSDRGSSLPCSDGGSVHNLESSGVFSKEAADQGFRKVEKFTQSALRSVVDLHLGDEKFPDSNKFDMEKALKGLGARDAQPSSLADVHAGRIGEIPTSSEMCPSEIRVAGRKAPLDFTLKTSLQLVSSSSVKWYHRISTSFATNSISELTSQSSHGELQGFGYASKPDKKSEILFSKALQSWAYPQSSLPSSIISALASSERDFLLRRQQDWEDSFRNLYYMLRKNLLNIFYVCTTQFVVLFLSGKHFGKKDSCNAYISQSTRGLRSLLRKNDVCFSMPLCHAEVEQATEDDLMELSEIEKRNLGQTLHMDSLSEVDHSPESLLSFTGNESVHGLFDFLLNYRAFLSSLCSVDVPVLYSPLPFQNASLRMPEVRCKEIRKADMIAPSLSGSESEEPGTAFGSSVSNICYSIEVKDAVLPPWVICGICTAMSSEGRSFDAIFATKASSMGLNVALDLICKRTDSKMPPLESCGTFGIPDAILVPSLQSASLRRLKYMDGAYLAYTTL